ncbi:hypothetical protein EZS27_022806 [termite gut metagenome]|uniref:Uncharacterized protein n=1 Tax=termite gut metagenome TaxID=433724 RepID=A0A5J4R292_9ZZZZ
MKQPNSTGKWIFYNNMFLVTDLVTETKVKAGF